MSNELLAAVVTTLSMFGLATMFYSMRLSRKEFERRSNQGIEALWGGLEITDKVIEIQKERITTLEKRIFELERE